MKISIINDNEIHINYLISDTTPEINLPRFDYNKYDLIVGNNQNKLKCITYDNLKKIFKDNKEDYKVLINRISISNEKLLLLYTDKTVFLKNIFSMIKDRGFISYKKHIIHEDKNLTSINNVKFNSFESYNKGKTDKIFFEIHNKISNYFNNINQNLNELENSIKNNYSKYLPIPPKLNFSKLYDIEKKIKRLEEKFN